MNVVEARALLAVAAEPTMARLRADRDRASHRIAPLVAYIAEHLFDVDLNYEQVRQACGVRDNNRTTLFQQELGLTPAAYIRDCRMEVACRLLRTTTLDIAWIAKLVGYTGPQIFTSSFKRYSGVTPSWYRGHEERRAPEKVEVAPADRVSVDTSPTTWRRFITAELTPDEARNVLKTALGTYPELQRELLDALAALLVKPPEGDATTEGSKGGTRVSSLRQILSVEDLEALVAEEVWESIRALPPGERLHAIHRPIRFKTPALLRLIGETVLREVEVDPRSAVQLAQLALEHAGDLSRSLDDDGTGAWRSLAWVWLAVARRKAGDDDGAAKAFGVAERFLEQTTGEEAGSVLAQELLADAVLTRS